MSMACLFQQSVRVSRNEGLLSGRRGLNHTRQHFCQSRSQKPEIIFPDQWGLISGAVDLGEGEEGELREITAPVLLA